MKMSGFTLQPQSAFFANFAFCKINDCSISSMGDQLMECVLFYAEVYELVFVAFLA